MKSLALSSLLLLAASVGGNGAVVITPGDLLDPLTEDFESRPVGPVDPGFLSAIYLSDITATIDGSLADVYEARPNSTRALAGNGGELQILDPGDNIGPLAASYTLDFSAEIAAIGFSLADHGLGNPIVIDFFFRGNPVDNFSFLATTPDSESIVLRPADRFDLVTISQDTQTGLGFVLDDLAIELVPEPSTGLLATLGALGLLIRRRRPS